MDEFAAVVFVLVGIAAFYLVLRAAVRSGVRDALREHEAARVAEAATRHSSRPVDADRPDDL